MPGWMSRQNLDDDNYTCRWDASSVKRNCRWINEIQSTGWWGSTQGKRTLGGVQAGFRPAARLSGGAKKPGGRVNGGRMPDAFPSSMRVRSSFDVRRLFDPTSPTPLFAFSTVEGVGIPFGDEAAQTKAIVWFGCSKEGLQASATPSVF